MGFRNLSFSRLDGSMSFVDRQDNIDRWGLDIEVRLNPIPDGTHQTFYWYLLILFSCGFFRKVTCGLYTSWKLDMEENWQNLSPQRVNGHLTVLRSLFSFHSFFLTEFQLLRFLGKTWIFHYLSHKIK